MHTLKQVGMVNDSRKQQGDTWAESLTRTQCKPWCHSSKRAGRAGQMALWRSQDGVSRKMSTPLRRRAERLSKTQCPAPWHRRRHRVCDVRIRNNAECGKLMYTKVCTMDLGCAGEHQTTLLYSTMPTITVLSSTTNKILI